MQFKLRSEFNPQGDQPQAIDALVRGLNDAAKDQVLLGITVATAVVHLASVGIGRLVGPGFSDHQWLVNVVAGVAFLGFAAWTLRGLR